MTKISIVLILIINLINFSAFGESRYASQSGNLAFDAEDNNTVELVIVPSGHVGINNRNPTSTLDVSGNIYASEGITTKDMTVSGVVSFTGIQTISTDTLLSGNSLIMADTSSDNLIITLPYAGNVLGRKYLIKKISTNNNIIIKSASGNIDKNLMLSMLENPSSLEFSEFISDGNEWYVMNRSNETPDQPTIAYWKFDETSGNTLSDSGPNHLNGFLTDSGNIFTFSGCTISGIHGTALDFDAVDDHITVDDNDILSFGDGTNDKPFSISVWIYMRTSAFTVLAKGKSTTDREYLFDIYSDEITFFLYTGNSIFLKQAYSPLTSLRDTWIHMVITYDGSKNLSGLATYVNGSKVTTTDTESGTYTGMSNLNGMLNIGKGFVAGYAEGRMDDLKIFNRVLIAEEVSTLHSKGQ